MEKQRILFISVHNSYAQAKEISRDDQEPATGRNKNNRLSKRTCKEQILKYLKNYYRDSLSHKICTTEGVGRWLEEISLIYLYLSIKIKKFF